LVADVTINSLVACRLISPQKTNNLLENTLLLLLNIEKYDTMYSLYIDL